MDAAETTRDDGAAPPALNEHDQAALASWEAAKADGWSVGPPSGIDPAAAGARLAANVEAQKAARDAGAPAEPIDEGRARRAVAVVCLAAISAHDGELSWPDLYMLTGGGEWPGMPAALKASAYRGVATDAPACFFLDGVADLIARGFVRARADGRLLLTPETRRRDAELKAARATHG